jgi:hypothetical protein
MLIVLKDEVIENKKLSIDDQNQIFREVVDEVRYRRCIVDSSLDNLLTIIVPRKWRPHHTTQVFPTRTWIEPPRRGLATHTCTEGVRDERIDEEGNREGWYNHKTCHYQDCKQAEVDYQSLKHWALGIVSMKAAFRFRSSGYGLCMCMIRFLYNFLAMYMIVIHNSLSRATAR